MALYLTDRMIEFLGWQVIGQINMLHDGMDDEGFPKSCCPICCGPCSALNSMLDSVVDRGDLEAMLAQHPYVKDGWAFWSKKRRGLRINKIKRKWLNADGTHKAVCMMSDGKDLSHEVHALIEAAEIRQGKHS